MRLARNGIRERHWHQQAEWAVMLDGECRVTILDEEGRAQVADVKTGDLWYFPPGLPHSLQGPGSTGAEFLLAFDDVRGDRPHRAAQRRAARATGGVAAALSPGK
jgi:oxalate decarboxylase